MTFLLDTTIRLSVLLVLALAAGALLGRRSAAIRHWILAAALTCSAAMPLLQVALPSWQVSIPSSSSERTVQPYTEAVTTEVAFDTPVRAGSEPRVGTGTYLPRVLAALWLAGAVLSLSMLVVGLRRLSRIASSASPMRGRPARFAAEIATATGLERPAALLQSGSASVLATWGLTRPTIILPAGAHEWPDDRLRIVLSHELAHVRRRDWAIQMLAEALRAIYWFNPLVWIACRRLRDASERACDDAVLTGGIEPPAYASHLLEVARDFTAMRRAPALAMARSSRLEGRIAAMLDARQDRGPITNRARAAIVAALLALAVPVAIAAQNDAFTVSGNVVDQTNKVVPGVSLTLANTTTATKVEATSDKAGHFEFANVSAGQYELRAAKPGFMLVVQRFAVNANVTRDLQIQLGDVHETVTVKIGVITPGRSLTADEVSRARRERQEQAANCPAGVQAGGNILPPWKVKDVKPVYPNQLKPSKESGVVTLNATIGTDGLVRDLKTVKSPNQEFTRAAIDAVRQWQFTPAYLNCAPVDLRMQVTVNFTAERK